MYSRDNTQVNLCGTSVEFDSGILSTTVVQVPVLQPICHGHWPFFYIEDED